MKLEKTQRHTLKIIAVFFAISLWFYVLNSEPVEIEKKIQIEFTLPKGYAISNQIEKQLTVKLKGSKAFIGNVLSNKETLSIDLNPYLKNYGKNFKVKYHFSQISVPFGVDILEISPKDSWIELDRHVQIELPVKIQYIGSMASEKKIIEVSVDPPGILISGPIDVLRKLSKVNSYPVNLSSIDGDDGSLNLNLEELDSRLKYEEDPMVKFNYKVETAKKDKSKKNKH